MVTNNYNEDTATGTSPAGGDNAVDDPKETGTDVVLRIGDEEIPLTSFDFSEEADTSEVQYNTGFHKSIAVTGVSYSGSFETSGNATALREKGWAEEDNNDSPTSLPQAVDGFSVEDSEKTYTFANVLLNSHSKDAPADDRTSHSFDFMAERLYEA
jgi:hypothetical protein